MMDRTERYEDRLAGTETLGPWVLLQAWPETRVVPMPVARPLGRDFLARFDVRDSLASAKHCRLHAVEGGLEVEDLGSTNGTWVDGARIVGPTRVAEGTVLRVGGCIFVVRRSSLREPEPPLDAGPAGTLVAPFGLTALRKSLAAIERARPGNVLVLGETGTGKEAVAWLAASRLGREKPFETVNASAYRSDTFDGAFFGYERGSFTGANVANPGIVAAAAGGTLFLDELGDMPRDFQPLLLRFLETREVRRVGAARSCRVELLVVAATNHDLEREIEDGTFRADLLARYAAPYLKVPPLRARREDVPSIARALLERAGASFDEETDVMGVERLMLHPHPLNVRGLRALLEQARADGGLRGEALGAIVPSNAERAPGEDEIRAALVAHGSERKAAEALGVTRRQVRNAKPGGSRSTQTGSRSGAELPTKAKRPTKR